MQIDQETRALVQTPWGGILHPRKLVLSSQGKCEGTRWNYVTALQICVLTGAAGAGGGGGTDGTAGAVAMGAAPWGPGFIIYRDK